MSNKQRLAIDAVMFVAVVALMNPVLTGIDAHIWLGFAVLVPALVHVSLNWTWSMRVVDRLFERMRAASRLNLVLGVLLFVSFVAVSLSGVMVMPVVANVFISTYSIWHAVHSMSAWAFTALMLVHGALHARWIAGVIARSLGQSSTEGALR